MGQRLGFASNVAGIQNNALAINKHLPSQYLMLCVLVILIMTKELYSSLHHSRVEAGTN